jgi:hypothetical protein
VKDGNNDKGHCESTELWSDSTDEATRAQAHATRERTASVVADW